MRWLVPLFLLAVGCSSATDATGETDDALQADLNRAPQIIRVPVRFTKNEVTDVGYAFSSSWIPFTDVSRSKVDGGSWTGGDPASATKFLDWYRPDRPGAGYVTAVFLIEIPFDTSGAPAYALARVKLESELIKTGVLSTVTRQYSPLRVRAGSDQPCLSVTLSGAIDGKLKAVPIPYTDEQFTERDWKIGDKDAKGVPIAKVVVGGLRFSPYCWPENVEGQTHVSGGAGIPPGGFVMVDKGAGQGGSDSAFVSLNLLENEKGVVSVGTTFSTNAAILDDRHRAEFDKAVTAFAKKFSEDVDSAAAAAAQYNAAPM